MKLTDKHLKSHIIDDWLEYMDYLCRCCLSKKDKDFQSALLELKQRRDEDRAKAVENAD